MLKGFNSIHKLDLDECNRLLNIEMEPERVELISNRINQIQLELLEKDNNCYKNCKTIDDYRFYLKDYPNGIHTVEASNTISELEIEVEQETFSRCCTIDQYQDYIETYPQGCYVQAASEKIDDLFFESNKHSKRNCKKYLTIYPTGRHVQEANQKIEKASRNKIIWLIVIILAILLLIIGYNSSGDIVFSDLNGNKSIPNKYTCQLVASTPPYMLCVPLLIATQVSDHSKEISFAK